MKMAAAKSIAMLARDDVPDEVVSAYGGERPKYGKNYIIPSTFDPRLLSVIPSAVAKAAIKSGVARKKINDFDVYKDELINRLDPSMSLMQGINAKIRKNPKKVIFAEGEDENMLKAAIEFNKARLGTPILIGSEERIKDQLKKIGLGENFKIQIVNSKDKSKREKYTKYLYKKLQRDGLLERDVDRLIRNDRVAWGSSMIACKDADAMVTGNIRHYAASVEKLKKFVDARQGETIFGMTIIVSKGKTVLVADTNVHDFPSSERLVNTSISCVRVARLFGFEPKVAFLSHSTFGKPVSRNTKHVRDAIELLKTKKVDFDFDGEMQPDVALNPIYQEVYPFSKIVGRANILIMPALHSAAISTKLMKTFGGAKLIGPLLIGLGLPIEVAPLRSSTSDILNLASVAAYSSDVIDY
jgi:malate dehydrogenase (oxaloacetate-decarboxylating)(NADP+)